MNHQKSSERRKPTWNLCVKEGERWRTIGAAWDTEKGNLFVKMDEGEVLRGTAMLFPYREKPANDARSGGWQKGRIYERPPVRLAPESDYMERKRHERPAATPPAAKPLPPTPPGDYDPDPEAPDWL